METTGTLETRRTVRTREKKRMDVPFVDLRTQYASISEEVEKGIKEVLKGCDFILGGKVSRFETEFAQYCGSAHAIGVASGTDALEIALKAHDIGPGDEVITQANTFIATLLAISAAGARPVLVDVDPETGSIDPEAVEEAVTERTRAVMPVHIYGRCAPMDRLAEVAGRHGLYIIEDACQAHGAWHHGADGPKRAGSIGSAAAFSFYPGKNLGAFGDGGMVTTSSRVVADRVRMLRDYGQTRKYHHSSKGYNSRLDTIQAAVLLVKLRRLDRWNTLRVEHASAYSSLLADVPGLRLPPFDQSLRLSHVFHLFVMRTEARDEFREYLTHRGIATGIHYPVPAHRQEAYADLGYRKGDFPVSERHVGEIVSLPMFPELTSGQVEYVVETVRDFYGC